MDADTDVVSPAGEEVWVSAGPASIAGVTAGIRALVWIPVVGAVIFSDESSEVIAVFCVIIAF